MADCINLILRADGPDTLLVEIEDDKGNSIRIGERIPADKNGLSILRIRPNDIKEA